MNQPVLCCVDLGVVPFEFLHSEHVGTNELRDHIVKYELASVLYLIHRSYMAGIKLFGYGQVDGWNVDYFNTMWARMTKRGAMASTADDITTFVHLHTEEVGIGSLVRTTSPPPHLVHAHKVTSSRYGPDTSF